MTPDLLQPGQLMCLSRGGITVDREASVPKTPPDFKCDVEVWIKFHVLQRTLGVQGRLVAVSTWQHMLAPDERGGDLSLGCSSSEVLLLRP